MPKTRRNSRQSSISDERSEQGATTTTSSSIDMGTDEMDSDRDFYDAEGKLQLLADTGENLLQKGDTTLTAICLYSIFKVAMEYTLTTTMMNCFKLGINVNNEIAPGMTPLMMSIATDKPEMVKTVVEYGADVNQKTKLADSPLHYAVDQMKTQAVEALLEVASRRLEINKLGSDGLAALHRAVRSHSKQLIQILVRYGADVNVKGESGATPLHIAASCSNCSAKMLP